MASRTLLVELFVEELPPRALKKLGDAFANTLFEQLKSQGLAGGSSQVIAYASPRRLAAQVTAVVSQAPDSPVMQKLVPVSVGLQGGRPTEALRKRLAKEGRAHLADLWPDAQDGADSLLVQSDGKADAIYLRGTVRGATLAQGLQLALAEAIARLPIPKVMTYQLGDGWTDVKFVRPVHRLLALHGAEVVPVSALGLQAGNLTEGHRFEAAEPVLRIRDADSYADQLLEQGAVIASFEARRAEIAHQLRAAAEGIGAGLQAVEDEALLDEVTALVERPNVLVCQFEQDFLEVPQECLVLTMKANQKYFPLLDASGRLVNRFLVVSNVRPQDASAVVGGNERVVRPRLADARFFFDQDRKKTLASRVEGLDRVVYHHKLGSQGERSERVVQIAARIARALQAHRDPGARATAGAALEDVETAARLAKADLLTDMVGEFPELQGIMGGYYARHDGLGTEVAQAIEDHYRPRFAGDALPRNSIGIVVALADKLETLVGLFGVGQLPTGDRDPFALRRHALGVVRMLIERALPLQLDELLHMAASVFGDLITDPAEALADFIYERLAGSLREQGYSTQQVDAVLVLRPQRLADVPRRLEAVRSFSELAQAPALAAANKRIGNILKKAPEAQAQVRESLLEADAEKALHARMQEVLPRAQAQFEGGDYTGSLQTLAALREAVDAFFDGVMVNAEDAGLRLNRLGLLATLHRAMNQVADLARLAS